MNTRLKNMRAKMNEIGIDTMLISSPDNRRYISGFAGSAGHLLISQTKAILATDFRYVEQAEAQSPEFQVVRISGGWSWLLDQLNTTKSKTLGIEEHHITVSTDHSIASALSDIPPAQTPNIRHMSGIVEELRSIKDKDELELLQKAIDIADKAMNTVLPTIQAGETERQVAWRMEKTMRELGADSLSFDTIVASGPNSAMPHHRPTDRLIRKEEPVVIDMGAKVDGYCSDITRTIFLGQDDHTFKKIYDIVLGSQLTAIATIKPEMTGGSGDELARGVIQKSGHGDDFGHGLGHGVGLAVHEHPRLGPSSPDKLKEGMVFSVEPGIYISGWGGIRIEDLVVLEPSGAKVLNKAHK